MLNKIEIKPETTYKKLKLELKNVLNHIKKSNTDLKNAFYKHLMKEINIYQKKLDDDMWYNKIFTPSDNILNEKSKYRHCLYENFNSKHYLCNHLSMNTINESLNILGLCFRMSIRKKGENLRIKVHSLGGESHFRPFISVKRGNSFPDLNFDLEVKSLSVNEIALKIIDLMNVLSIIGELPKGVFSVFDKLNVDLTKGKENVKLMFHDETVLMSYNVRENILNIEENKKNVFKSKLNMFGDVVEEKDFLNYIKKLRVRYE